MQTLKVKILHQVMSKGALMLYFPQHSGWLQVEDGEVCKEKLVCLVEAEIGAKSELELVQEFLPALKHGEDERSVPAFPR